ncbi:carbohydrate porin [soil metagenome]
MRLTLIRDNYSFPPQRILKMLMKYSNNISFRGLCFRVALPAVAVGLFTTAAWAEPDVLQDDNSPPPDWMHGDSALGGWGGYRKKLLDHGVEIFGGYTVDVWGNTTGGIKTGAVYSGLMDFGLNLDLEKAVGWKGASMNTTWLWLSGRDASEDLVGNFMTISNIAGFNTLRLQNLWFQQNVLDDKISLRVGQLSADSEFVISDYGSTFINGTFGWPPFMYMNLPNGGPGFPMGTLGIRLAVKPFEWMTLQSAVFQGDPYAQDVNRHGFRWTLDQTNGYFFINEAQVRWNHRDEEMGLPGQLKGGAWFHTAKFADSFNPENSHQGDCGFYAIMDQMLYREPSAPAESVAPAGKDGKSVVSGKDAKKAVVPGEVKSSQGLGWFGRIGFDPQDRNFLGFYVDTGLSYTGLIPTRDEDVLGLAFAYAQLSRGAQQQAIDGGASGVGAEMVIEATYQAKVTKWLSIQPDLQFIINPGGNQDLGNALMIGARAAITF